VPERAPEALPSEDISLTVIAEVCLGELIGDSFPSGAQRTVDPSPLRAQLWQAQLRWDGVLRGPVGCASSTTRGAGSPKSGAQHG
jgi:hypothetical protein